jgi:YHS domain-containing protein
MNSKAGALTSFMAAVGLIFAASMLPAGCAKEEPATPQPAKSMEKMATQAQASVDQANMPDMKAVAVEQKTCPVMDGNPIDKNVFVEYKGKKVYFCCAECKAKFLANPEQYIAKLPQFAQ